MKQKIIAAGGLVKNNKGELLMIFRRNKWDLPKGKLDKGETIEECALREVQEETGLKKIEMGKLIGTTLHEYFDKHVSQDVIKETYWFEMRASGDEKLTPQTEEDIEDIQWAGKEKVSTYLQQTYPNIKEIIQKAGYI